MFKDIGALGEELSKQAAWSDLPIIILTVGGSATTRSRRREQERLPLGSPVLLERPIRSDHPDQQHTVCSALERTAISDARHFARARPGGPSETGR